MMLGASSCTALAQPTGAASPLSNSTSESFSAQSSPSWLERIERELQGKENIDVLVEFRVNESAMSAARTLSQSTPHSGQASASFAAIVRQGVEETGRPLTAELQAQGMEVLKSYDYQPIIHMKINAAQLQRLAAREDVIAIRLNESFEREQEDSLNLERAAAQSSDDANKALINNTTTYTNADKAWAKGFRGQGYAIAVLDDGINANHELFKNGKIVAAACFSDGGTTGDNLCPGAAKSASGSGAASACSGGNEVCYHGSHVAGIAAGNNTPASFIRQGVAPDAKLIPIQVFHRRKTTTSCSGNASCLRANTSDLVAALDWLIANGPTHNLAAVNMSLGGGEYSNYCDSESTLTSGINILRAMGILTAIAAGNEGLTGKISHPACIRNAVAVSSVIITVPEIDHNHSAIVDLLAPGFLVNSASNAGPTSYITYGGTSMATPHVAGAFAVLRSKLPSATADQIEFALKSTGPLATWPTWTWSTSRIDVNAALDAVGQTPPPAGVALMNFLPGADTSGFSYIRVANPTFSSGTATLSLFQDVPKVSLGKYSVSVPSRSAKQIRINEIEAAIGKSGIATTNISIYVDANFRGYAQNIVWNAEGQSLTNLTICKSSLVDPVNFVGNTHTSRINGYSSYISIHNLGIPTAKATLDMYDSNNGSFIGSVTTGDIPGNTSAYFPVQQALDAISFQPTTAQFHVNFLLRSGFSGIVQHVVDNETAGLFTDMTGKCPI